MIIDDGFGEKRPEWNEISPLKSNNSLKLEERKINLFLYEWNATDVW